MTAEPEHEEQPEPAEEAPEQPEGGRVAGAVLLVAVVGFAGHRLIVAAPELLYAAGGAAATLGTQRARKAWADLRDARAERAETKASEEQQTVQVELLPHLQALSKNGTENVLLTRLQAAAGLPDTKAVRALLKATKGPAPRGVRTPHGNGPGIHMDDIPPAPPPVAVPPVEGCCCRSGDNDNANNAPEKGVGEGFRVVPIGQAGAVVHDPADVQRHHPVGR